MNVSKERAYNTLYCLPKVVNLAKTRFQLSYKYENNKNCCKQQLVVHISEKVACHAFIQHSVNPLFFIEQFNSFQSVELFTYTLQGITAICIWHKDAKKCKLC